MDEIRIRELEVYAYHGVLPEENEKGQHFYVNADLRTDTRRAGQTDELSDSTHYGEVCRLITRVLTKHIWKLIETAAEHVAEAVLLTFPHVRSVKLEIRKPEAPIGLPFSSVSVAIERGWHRAYIAFGSNLGDKKKHIENGLELIRQHPLIRVTKSSDIMTSKPYGGVEQADFLNGVLEAETLLPPGELLDVLHRVEAAEKRERTVRWGPRTLDLDLLLYDRLVYEDAKLILPHVDMENRDFVLQPMVQIAPNLRHPVLGKTMCQLWERLKSQREENDV